MPSGLPNFGSTCYLNALIQAIRVCPPISQMQVELKVEPGPQDVHETWLRIVDTQKYPKHVLYGIQEDTCVSKTLTETQSSEFGCLIFYPDAETTLDMCIDKYTAPECITTGDSSFTIKTTKIIKVPDVLVYVFHNSFVIHLPETDRYGKKLRAAILHGHGHYVAAVCENDSWFIVDDMNIHSLTEFHSGRIYMAFYV